MNKPHYINVENIHTMTGKKFYKSLVLLPNCCKHIVNYYKSNKGYLKKKDSEGYTAL